MPFYQNPFFQDFFGVYYNVFHGGRDGITFKVPQHHARGHQDIVSYNKELYDFSVDNILTIRFALNNLEAFASLAINVAGATPISTTSYEVVAALTADPTFASLFRASVKNPDVGTIPNAILISAKKPIENFRFYIVNSSAERKLRFNKLAGVEEIPSYFSRHTVQNTITANGIDGFSDSLGLLIELNPANPEDLAIIQERTGNPLWAAGDLLDDWQMLLGRSPEYIFTKNTYDGSSRLTNKLEYRAGAKVGDHAKLTQYQYVGLSTTPAIVTEIPHVIIVADLVLPPP